MDKANRITARLIGGSRQLLRAVARAAAHRGGNVAIFFSLSLLPLMAIAGAGVDFMAMSAMRSALQAAADAGALRAARELRLARTGAYDLTPVARTAALSILPNAGQAINQLSVRAALIDNNQAVQVIVSGYYDPKVLRIVYKQPVPMSAKAVARTNGYPICALGLDQTIAGVGTIYLEANARVTAQFCAVYSNSKSPVGITALHNAKLTAGQICSVGGTLGVKANFMPAPQNDCPVVADPLASRPAPPVGSCTHSNEVVDGGTVTLMPGTYCGGLKAVNGAIVNLAPGEYVMKDGPIVVESGSTLNAQGAGVYLTGPKATIQFASASTIRMTAPTTGPLAGMLFFEDRASAKYQVHKLTSDNAPVLLGAIYLPQGVLMVDGNSPVGQQSAFTIVIARRLSLMAGPNLVLNSDYASSNVPVPGGLTPGLSYLSQ